MRREYFKLFGLILFSLIMIMIMNQKQTVDYMSQIVSGEGPDAPDLEQFRFSERKENEASLFNLGRKPDNIQFIEYANRRFIGREGENSEPLAVGQSVQECLSSCVENPSCKGVSYKATGECLLLDNRETSRFSDGEMREQVDADWNSIAVVKHWEDFIPREF